MDDQLSYAVELRVLIEKTEPRAGLKISLAAGTVGGLVFLLGAPEWFCFGVAAIAFVALLAHRDLRLVYLRNEWAKFCAYDPEAARRAREEVNDMKVDRHFWRGIS